MSHDKATSARIALKAAMCSEIAASPRTRPRELEIMERAKAYNGPIRFYREPCFSLRVVHTRIMGTDPHDDYLSL